MIFLEILQVADCDALEAIRREFDYACGLLQPSGISWKERVESVPEQNNHFFCPTEKVDRFNEVVRSVGYRVG